MFSDEHKKFIKKIKLRNALIKFSQLFILIIFISVWQYLADTERINTFIFSSPSKVFQTVIS